MNSHPNCMSYLSHEWRFFVQAPWHQFFSQCPWHLCSTSSCTHNLHSSFLWFSQNICCLSLQINYHGGDYLTLIDSYCSAMLVEQLVWSIGYVMLLQFMGTGEAPERVRS
uniref:Uncharacterized protein n=1 Tax=Triticum urartu TaxID=4572 RepID=A0A8R7K355_TRIUA